MANWASDTADITALMLSAFPGAITENQQDQPEARGGDDPTGKSIMVPYAVMARTGFTPKLNDWIVRRGQEWLITGISLDPLDGAYTFTVRKL
jgi:hypothetical protein